MTKYFLLFSFMLLAISVRAQDQDEVPIGQQRGVKEKLIIIKKGLPDIKNNLTTQDEMWLDQRNVKFEMGDGMVIYSEDEYDGVITQQIRIEFSTKYFTGTIKDFQDYYKKLVNLVNEIFGEAYEAISEEEKWKWETTFTQSGKKYKSPVSINVEVNWLSEPTRFVSIEVHSKQ